MDIESIVNWIEREATVAATEEHARGLRRVIPKLESYATSQREMRKGLEKLRDELYNGEVLTRSESSEFSTPEDSYSEGWQAAESDIRAKLSTILEGKA